MTTVVGETTVVNLCESAVCLLDGKFCALEADATVRAIAERFVDRTAAAAERKSGFAREIVWSSVCVDQFHRSLRRFYTKWAIRTDGDFHLSHIIGSSNHAAL
jgi:predicted trehalose synthase